MVKVKEGFFKRQETLSNENVLLAHGGHKPLSEFKIGDYLPIAGGTMTGNINFATGATPSTANGIHFSNGSHLSASGNTLYVFGASGVNIYPSTSSTSGLEITDSSLKYKSNTVLDSGNSSVSGGGSAWGASITVKINNVEKTLQLPQDPNHVETTGSTNQLAHYKTTSTIGAVTATIGTSNNPIWINAGVPTASGATVGSAGLPVYLSGGKITAITGTQMFSGFGATGNTTYISIAGATRNLTIPYATSAGKLSANAGNTTQAIYFANGVPTALTGTTGAANQPIYLNSGKFTPITYTINATVNSGTQNQLVHYSSATTIGPVTGSIGASNCPIWINAGVPTASGATVGSATNGIYLAGGIITKMTYNLAATINSGTAGKLAYYSNGTTISAYTSTVGNSIQPIYMSGGTPTAGATYFFIAYTALYGGKGATNINFNIPDSTRLSGTYYLNTAINGATTAFQNAPQTYGLVVDFNQFAGHLQFASTNTSNEIKARSYWWTNNSGGFTYPSWVTLIHTGNYTNYLGYIATTAVQASSTPGQNITGVGHITPNANAGSNIGSATLHFANGYFTNLYVSGSTSYTSVDSAVSGTFISQGRIELTGASPYLDFKANNAGIDYQTRLQATVGKLTISRNSAVSATAEAPNQMSATTYNSRDIYPLLHVGGTILSGDIESSGSITNNRNANNGGFYIRINGNNYGFLRVHTIGTAASATSASAYGISLLELGNNIAEGATGTTNGAHNSRGLLRLYGNNSYFQQVWAQTNNFTDNRNVYLPQYNGTAYLIHGGSNDAIGTATRPVYIAANGRATVGTYSLNATINSGTASKLAYYSSATAISAYTTTVGSVTNGIYLNAGVPTKMTYDLAATVSAGTVSRIAYYSNGTTISAYAATTGGPINPIYLNAGVPTLSSMYRTHYDSSEDYATYKYHKVAYVTNPGTNNDRWVRFSVNCGYGTEGLGELYIRSRTNGNGVIEATNINWIVRSSSLNINNFLLLYTNDTTNNTCTIEFWCIIPGRWKGYAFRIIDSGNRGGNGNLTWTLCDSNTGHGATALPSVTATVVSSDITSVVDDRYVLKAGDTMLGTLNTMNLIPKATNTYTSGSTSLLWSWTHTNRINLNRAGNAAFGRIYYYNSSYYTWVDYMSQSTAGYAPTGGQPSTTTEVTSWAKRSLIENSAGYGWIWEACTNAAAGTTSTKPTARMSLSSNTGRLRVESAASTTANNTGGLIISTALNASSGNIALELWRGTNASWMISNEAGDLHIRDNYTTAVQTTYLHDNVKIAYNTGTITAHSIQPAATNTYNLGSASLRWAKLYIGTADSYGSATKPIYWNAGVPAAITHSLNATVNAGTANRLAYYSSATAISAASTLVSNGTYIRRAAVSSSWNNTDDNSMIFQDSVNGLGAVLSIKTTNNHSWSIAHYNHANYHTDLMFGFLHADDHTGATTPNNRWRDCISLIPITDAGTSRRAFVTANYTRSSETNGNASVGNATKPVYVNAKGIVTAVTHALNSTVNAGTANLLAYYSSATSISSTPGIAYFNTTGATGTTARGISIFSTAVGNSNQVLSGVAGGPLQYGDGGPQIRFFSATSPDSGQAGAIIFSDYDNVGANASFSFVSNQSRIAVISKEFLAHSRLTVGTTTINTNYRLQVDNLNTSSWAANFHSLNNGIHSSIFLSHGDGHGAWYGVGTTESNYYIAQFRSGITNNGSGGTTVLYVRADRRVGIGTDSPAHKLDVIENGGNGSIRIYGAGDSAADAYGQILIASGDQTNSKVQSGFVRVYNTHANNTDGSNMIIQSGGVVCVGSGESPTNLYNASLKNSTAETLYLTSDNKIFFDSNCQTIANRVGMSLSTGGYLYPTVADVETNNSGYIGSATYRWAGIFAQSVNSRGYTIQFDTDSSRAQSLSWTNTGGSVVGSIVHHNTAQNLILNSIGASSTYSDAVGKYSLIVGNNKLTYNTYPILTSNNWTSYVDGRYLPLAGGTMTGQINSTYVGSRTYISALKNAPLNITPASAGYTPILNAPTKTGRVGLTTYSSTDDYLYFGWATQTKVDNNTNSLDHRMIWEGSTGNLAIDRTAPVAGYKLSCGCAYIYGATVSGTYAGRTIAVNINTGVVWLTQAEATTHYMLNRTSAGGGYYYWINNTQHARLFVETLGTASTETTQGALGSAILILGNNIARGATGTTIGANNSRGYLRLFAANQYYTQIIAQGNGNHSFYLPNYSTDMYAVHTANNNAVGSASTPVYVAANGRVTAFNTTIGNSVTPVYVNNGVITPITDGIVTLTGGNGNTAGWRVVYTWTITANSRQNLLFFVQSPNSGNGLISITIGCKASTISAANVYAAIIYNGPSDKTKYIQSIPGSFDIRRWELPSNTCNYDSWRIYLSSDYKTAYLLWRFISGNTTTVKMILPLNATLTNGTWMTSINTTTYKYLWANTILANIESGDATDMSQGWCTVSS